MGYEAHAPSIFFLIVFAAVVGFEELREKMDKFADKIRAKMEK